MTRGPPSSVQGHNHSVGSPDDHHRPARVLLPTLHLPPGMVVGHPAAPVPAALGDGPNHDTPLRLGYDVGKHPGLPAGTTGAQGSAAEVSGTGVIVQFEGAKRNLTLIFGKHVGDPDDEVFVSNTSGDFDPAPSDDDDLDDDGESDGFGFRPQRTTASITA